VRLSDADREGLFEQLSAHAAAGRLDLAELERRVAAIAASQTREDAAAVMGDLPASAAPAAPAGAEARPRWGRGHGDADSPSPGWQPTSERFRDPRTKRVMRVWIDAQGGRHYVTDE
jgi:hypothetical protein